MEDDQQMKIELELMGEFFDRRIDGYEMHQLTCIEGAQEFYPYTAKCLPLQPNAKVLDLGCGTGLELEYYFKLNPEAEVTGIDLAQGMLQKLKEKFASQKLHLIQGSYFDVPLKENEFDAVVSVESLHHFTQAQKTVLYQKIHASLKPKGTFILTDYFALSEKEEAFHQSELQRLKLRQNIKDDVFVHYDTPLTVEHEIEALRSAGFERVIIVKQWGATSILQASKQAI